MVPIESYKANPCKTLSIPYWKAKSISIPPNMKIVHDSEFDSGLLDKYLDKKYFRLKHNLQGIPDTNIPGIRFDVIPQDKTDELADMINRSYTHSGILVTAEYIKGLTATPVYCPELWISAVLEGKMVGSILCDFDKEVGEAVIEWFQVLPEYRGRGIASALTCKALKKMSGFANFATVSGECDNITNPEKVYRRCGFQGNDIWHILKFEGAKT